jgi:hypothetical protein
MVPSQARREQERASSGAPDSDLSRGYRAAAGVFDELADASGALKSHWQPLLGLGSLDPRRALRVGSSTSACAGSALPDLLRSRNATHSWRIDLVPLISASMNGARSALPDPRARLFRRPGRPL